MQEEAIKDITKDVEATIELIKIIGPRMALLAVAVMEMEEELAHYEAIGIIDGTDYFNNVTKKKAQLERLKAILNLLQVFRDTNKDL